MSTLRTTLGYIRSLIGKYSPLEFKADSLNDVYNFLPITDSLFTSGQPTEKQFELVKAAGFNTVINLAPHDAENSLADEAATLSDLGIRYIHIPVNFKRPSERKFEAFCEVMQETNGQKVWVHCAANMRVSAFVFRYRRDVLKQDEESIRVDLNKIWEPFGVWKDFVG